MTQRIAVIGAGLMGADHARIVAQDLPGAVLQVVCDLDRLIALWEWRTGPTPWLWMQAT